MGTLLVSRRGWSVHLVRGRPGGRFHVGSGGRPTDSSTWRSMAWCAGVLSGSLATCPNMALRHLVIRSDTGARPVRKETSELRTKSCYLIFLFVSAQFSKRVQSFEFAQRCKHAHVNICIIFDFILYYNLLLCFIPLEMHVRLICAIKFYLLTYLNVNVLWQNL